MFHRITGITPGIVRPPARAFVPGRLGVAPARAMNFGTVNRARVPVGGIRDYFCLILGVGSFCLLLLGVPLSPTVDMFKTTFKGFTVDVSGYFDGNSAVTVNDGVSALTWGEWRGCFYNTTESEHCTAKQWINNPYTFTVSVDNYRIHATAQKDWSRAMFIHFFCFCVFIMVIAEAQVFQEIKNEMETLSSGGKQVVDTHVTGFGSTIVAGIFICGLSFFLFLKHGIQILQLRVVIAKTDKAYREAADLQDLVDAYQKRARIRANMTMLEARARAGWENPNPRTTKKQLPRLRVF